MDVVKTLSENNLVPKKEFDQFFLKDDKILNQEVTLAKLKPGDTVLEIGAGPGNLTEKIAKKSKVIAIEKDYSFRNILKIENTNVLFGDALEIMESLRTGVENGKAPVFNKIISNVPYSITQDILIEILRHKWDVAVLVVQKEFAQKLKGKEKLAIILDECCEFSIALNIPAKSFYPEAVESSVIVLKQKKLLDFAFWEFLKTIYRDKNKDAKKVLKNCPEKLSKKKIHQLSAGELRQLYDLSK